MALGNQGLALSSYKLHETYQAKRIFSRELTFNNWGRCERGFSRISVEARIACRLPYCLPERVHPVGARTAQKLRVGIASLRSQ